ncbi:peptidase M23 [Nitritalea halalkaliphila LW7]|uniref:Peptidase M23 n=1 Tax=Nitritalea halalkaliphila LW7 TaxID=1189621 RepID=I5BZQ0_9BACT|nr:peptidase M23 [Nitritalea halalkaliphila LW7]
MEVDRKDRFISGLRQIMVGEDPEQEPTPADRLEGDALPQRRDLDLFEKNADTEAIIAEFREGVGPYADRVEGIRTPGGETYFFAPLRGMVISAFNPGQQHFGVDILSKENEPVKAVTGGRVIFASWTLDTGHVIGIQHDGDLISFYKHNSVLLKKIGDAVTAGEPIAIIGGTGELSSGEHLHFELWYRGSPVNPQEFIKFD